MRVQINLVKKSLLTLFPPLGVLVGVVVVVVVVGLSWFLMTLFAGGANSESVVGMSELMVFDFYGTDGS